MTIPNGTLKSWLPWILLIFSIGASYGATKWQLDDMQNDQKAFNTRLGKIEMYLEKSTKGDFTAAAPDDPPGI